MTISEFEKQFGAEMRKFRNKPIFEALVSVMNDEGPAEKAADRLPGDIVVGGHVLYAEIQGHRRAVRLLKTIGTETAKTEEPPSDYRQPEI